MHNEIRRKEYKNNSENNNKDKNVNQSFSCFVINLEKDKERKDHMTKTLTHADISFSFSKGIVGKDMIECDEYDKQKAIESNGLPLTVGELGCALSHKRIYQKMKEENIAYAFICEDDVVLPKNMKTVIEREIEKNNNNNNKQWEYLLFDYPMVGLPFFMRWCKDSYIRIKRSIFFLPYVVLKFPYMATIALYEELREKYYKKVNIGKACIFLRPLYFAGAYIVTQEGAEKMLAMSDWVLYPADRLPNQARIKKGMICRGYVPSIVHQDRDSFTSNIVV